MKQDTDADTTITHLKAVHGEDGKVTHVPLTKEEEANIVELTAEEKEMCVGVWLRELYRFYIVGTRKDPDALRPKPCSTCLLRTRCEKDVRCYPVYLRSFGILYSPHTPWWRHRLELHMLLDLDPEEYADYMW